MSHTMPRRFGTRETAEFLGIRLQTLKNWIAANSAPPFYRVGAKLIFDQAELAEWMAARRVTPKRQQGSAA